MKLAFLNGAPPALIGIFIPSGIDMNRSRGGFNRICMVSDLHRLSIIVL